jgi:carbon-monoxide dehydrogenase medium subunit
MGNMEYLVSSDLPEILETLAELKGRAKLIAGGTNVIPDLGAGRIAPELIIHLGALEGLDRIREADGFISLGALTTISVTASSKVIRKGCPILSSAAGLLGSPLTRNRATIAGNLADASPAADLAPPLLALEASIHTERSGGRGRKIPMDRFFVGPNKTLLEADEVITMIGFPKPKDPATGSHIKLGLRNAMAISVGSIALMLEMDGNRCKKARVGLGAVAPQPIRAYRVEERLEGKEISQALIDACAEVVKEEISPISDIRASADYRSHATSVLLKRAIRDVLKREKRD